MGYRIEYDTHIGKFEIRQDRPKSFFPLYVAGAFLLFLVLTFCFWEAGAERIRSIIIPGEDKLTLQALNSLTQNLKQGTPLWEAVEAFCLDVIHGSQSAN